MEGAAIMAGRGAFSAFPGGRGPEPSDLAGARKPSDFDRFGWSLPGCRGICAAGRGDLTSMEGPTPLHPPRSSLARPWPVGGFANLQLRRPFHEQVCGIFLGSACGSSPPPSSCPGAILVSILTGHDFNGALL